MIIIVTILLALSTIFSIYAIFNNEEDIEEDEITEETTISEISETIEDECTDEYEEEQNTRPVSATEEKVSANAELILKKYYSQCDHTINEYVELPQELVNMTKDEVNEHYPEWEVIGFSPDKVTLYKEFDDDCKEHFKLKIEDGKVVVYIINNDETESLYKKTNISSEYLTEVDLMNMQEGLEVYGKEELNKIIEDFE